MIWERISWSAFHYPAQDFIKGTARVSFPPAEAREIERLRRLCRRRAEVSDTCTGIGRGREQSVWGFGAWFPLGWHRMGCWVPELMSAFALSHLGIIHAWITMMTALKTPALLEALARSCFLTSPEISYHEGCLPREYHLMLAKRVMPGNGDTPVSPVIPPHKWLCRKTGYLKLLCCCPRWPRGEDVTKSNCPTASLPGLCIFAYL